jgi:hypothetical protein
VFGSRGHFLLGEFTLADGRAACLIHNQDPARTQWATVTFAPELNLPTHAARVLEVDPVHGTLAPLMDDSPLYPGLQLGLQPGMARFLVAAPQRNGPAKTDDGAESAAGSMLPLQSLLIGVDALPAAGRTQHASHGANAASTFAKVSATLQLSGDDGGMLLGQTFAGVAAENIRGVLKTDDSVGAAAPARMNWANPLAGLPALPTKRQRASRGTNAAASFAKVAGMGRHVPHTNRGAQFPTKYPGWIGPFHSSAGAVWSGENVANGSSLWEAFHFGTSCIENSAGDEGYTLQQSIEFHCGEAGRGQCRHFHRSPLFVSYG